VDPVPSETALMRCYGSEYFYGAEVIGAIGPGLDYRTPVADIEQGKVKGYSEVTANFELTGKVILEVGCATGALLQSLRKHAPAVLIGIDIAQEQVAYGREHYGLDLRCTKLEEAGFAPGQFDLIIMLDVIEHAWDTRAFFAAAVHCLREGGALLIRTPNADSYRTAGWRWFYLHHGLEHVAYLSRASLAILAGEHRMVVERTATEGCPLFMLPHFRHGKLARIFCEPLTVISNRWRRLCWRMTSASKDGRGLDMSATVRKEASTSLIADIT
jgi:SAM-dependent methyltransferase